MFFYVSLLCFSMLVFSFFVGQNEGENLTQALKFCVPLEQKREEVSAIDQKTSFFLVASPKTLILSKKLVQKDHVKRRFIPYS